MTLFLEKVVQSVSPRVRVSEQSSSPYWYSIYGEEGNGRGSKRAPARSPSLAADALARSRTNSPMLAPAPALLVYQRPSCTLPPAGRLFLQRRTPRQEYFSRSWSAPLLFPVSEKRTGDLLCHIPGNNSNKRGHYAGVSNFASSPHMGHTYLRYWVLDGVCTTPVRTCVHRADHSNRVGSDTVDDQGQNSNADAVQLGANADIEKW